MSVELHSPEVIPATPLSVFLRRVLPAFIRRQASIAQNFGAKHSLQFVMLGLLLALLVFSASLIVRGAALNMLRAIALSEAQERLDYLDSTHIDFQRLLRGDPMTSKAVLDLEAGVGNGEFLGSRMFDLEGRLRQATGVFKINSVGDGSTLEQIAPDTAAAVLAGVTKVETSTDLNTGMAAFLSDTYLPIRRNDTIIGVMNFRIDQTKSRAFFFSLVGSAAMQLAFIISIAFGVPVLGFWFQSRQKERAERKLSFLVSHDTLTSLANRTTFQRQLEALSERGSADDRKFAVHQLNIDDFKTVNDTHGLAIGDELLRQVSRRLRETLRDSDVLARLGGDEFAIIQAGVVEKAAAESLAERIRQALLEPFLIDGQRIRISTSSGVALSPADGLDAARISAAADLALYFAKSTGASNYRFYEPVMLEDFQRRRAIEARIKEGVENELFSLHYQPLVDARTRALLGFEALLRLPDAEGKMISPMVFVPVVEELGLINRLGCWVIEVATREAATWTEPLTISVNLSPLQFRDGQLVETVRAALAAAGLPAAQLELEVTEGVLLSNSEAVRQQLRDLKALGVGVVLDDFGTGYSSLSYLWQFRFDKIKIDQSFVRALGVSGEVPSILSAIIALGRALKVSILAEGVETSAQADRLEKMGCEQFQGYLFSRPVPAVNIAGLIESLGAQSELRTKKSNRRLGVVG